MITVVANLEFHFVLFWVIYKIINKLLSCLYSTCSPLAPQNFIKQVDILLLTPEMFIQGKPTHNCSQLVFKKEGQI